MATNWHIGDRIQNRWQIYRILKGGMGVVYVVYDHELHNAYAAKTFQDEVFARSPTCDQPALSRGVVQQRESAGRVGPA